MLFTMSNSKDVRAIVACGGGPSGLHERSKEWVRQHRLERPIAEKTIYSWFAGGIPEKHWSFVMPVCGATEGEIHAANEALRRTPATSRLKRRAEARAA